MIRAFHQPKALDKALALIAQGATPVAGATALYTAKAERELELVDITRLKLDKIKVAKDEVVLGATVTLSQIADDERITGMTGAVLRRGARALASRPLRNAVTLGGNIAHPCFWADMPVVLLALDATLEVERAGAEPRLVPIAEALEARAKTWEGGLITHIHVPLAKGTVGFGHERLSRTTNDYALATACATLRRDGSVARDIRLVLGAIQARPFLVDLAPSMLDGREFTGHLLDELAEKLKGKISVAPNFRAAADYRKQLAVVLAKRALATAFAWAMREN
jgi:CO/xanthine dehydrogenase FAD-binding subunit